MRFLNLPNYVGMLGLQQFQTLIDVGHRQDILSVALHQDHLLAEEPLTDLLVDFHSLTVLVTLLAWLDEQEVQREVHHVLVLVLLAQEKFELAIVHVVEHAREPGLLGAVAVSLNQAVVKQSRHSQGKVTVSHLYRLFPLNPAVSWLIDRHGVEKVEQRRV